MFRLHSLPAFAKELRLSRVDGPLFARFREALREAERIHGERGRRLTRLALLRQLLCEALLLNVGVYASLTWRLLVRKDISVGVFLSLGFAAENLVALADSLAGQLGAPGGARPFCRKLLRLSAPADRTQGRRAATGGL